MVQAPYNARREMDDFEKLQWGRLGVVGVFLVVLVILALLIFR